MRSRAVVVVALLAAVVGSACSSSTKTTQSGGPSATAGNLSASLSGAGSTFVAPAMLEWISRYKSIEPSVHLNYQGIGSGGGVEQFIGQKIDFGASDAFMSDSELAAAQKARGCDVVHIPTVFGAVAVAFNAPGLDTITLDGPTLASIFLGKIKNYDDPVIKALNPGVTLPNKAIVVAHRSDGSGTTSIFTKYLASVSPEWKSKVGPGGKTVSWPVGLGGQGNDGVAAAIKQNEGGIGYIELSYALDNSLKTALVKNSSGKSVAPSVDSTVAATSTLQVPADLRFTVSNVRGGGYPIVGSTWVLAYECGYSSAKAAALKDFLKWALNSGDSVARELHYAPITGALKDKALANVDRINSKP